MYLSDGFRVSSVWDLYSNGTTSGKVMLLARGMSGIIGQVEFVYVSYTDEGLNVAQEKINMSLSDGFQIYKFWENIVDGTIIGKILVLVKVGCTTSEDYD